MFIRPQNGKDMNPAFVEAMATYRETWEECLCNMLGC